MLLQATNAILGIECLETVWKFFQNYTNSRMAYKGTLLQYARYIPMKLNILIKSLFSLYHLGIILKNGLLKSVPSFLLLCLMWARLY